MKLHLPWRQAKSANVRQCTSPWPSPTKTFSLGDIVSSGHSIYSASYVNKNYFVKDITKFNTRLLHPESTTSEVVLPQLYCRMANPCTVQEYTLDIPFQNKHHHFNIKVVICCIIRCRKWEKKERGGGKVCPPLFMVSPYLSTVKFIFFA